MTGEFGVRLCNVFVQLALILAEINCPGIAKLGWQLQVPQMTAASQLLLRNEPSLFRWRPPNAEVKRTTIRQSTHRFQRGVNPLTNKLCTGRGFNFTFRQGCHLVILVSSASLTKERKNIVLEVSNAQEESTLECRNREVTEKITTSQHRIIRIKAGRKPMAVELSSQPLFLAHSSSGTKRGNQVQRD